MDYDTWKTSPPEPDIVGECAYCGGELYDRCEYFYDNGGSEWFCDTECYLEKMRDEGILVTKAIEK